MSHPRSSGRSGWRPGACRIVALLAIPIIVAACSLVSSAWAGPNAGGAIVLHTDNAIAFSSGQNYNGASGHSCADPSGVCPLPDDGCGCAWLTTDLTNAATRASSNEANVVWALAVFPPGTCPRITAASFGITWSNEGDLAIAGYETTADFELAGLGWPDRGTGTALTWAAPREGQVIELYWFGVYATYASIMRPMGNPAQEGLAEFGDDATPTTIDVVEHFGTMGFGYLAGSVSDFGCGPLVGACCALSGCTVQTQDTCTLPSSVYLGDNTVCTPDPCPITSVEVAPALFAVSLPGGTSEVQLLTLTNTGSERLLYQVAITDPVDWLTFVSSPDAPVNGVLGPFETLAIDIHFDASGPISGVQTTTIAIESNDTSQPYLEVPVELTVVGTPDLSVDPTVLEWTIPTGSSANSTVALFNTGDALLAFSIAGKNLPPWLTVLPEEGTVPPDSSVDLTVGADAGELLGGVYAATISILTNDPDTPVADVGVTLNVTGEPDIDFPIRVVNFGDVAVGSPASATIEVANLGDDTLHVASLRVSNGPFFVPNSTIAVPPEDARSLEVFFSPPTAGSKFGVIWATSDDPDQPFLRAITVFGTGVAAASPEAEPKTATARGDDPAALIRSLGGSPGLALAPNPSSGLTSLVYRTPEGATDARLTVFDVTGRVVQDLAVSPAPGTPEVVTWDGMDLHGAKARSGVYFVRLRSGALEATERLTLAR